jgi:tRNA G18 (ribose-2'-O)-methylase SpoU
MIQRRLIQSLDLPELQPYRTMRRQMEHRKQGLFVAEGEKVVRRLLDSHFPVVSVLLPEKWYRELEPVLEARPETIHVFVAEKSLLETLTGFSMYQGLLALGRIPPGPSLDQILDQTPPPLLLAAVEGLSSAENLGAVVRNCAGLGVQALVVGETCTSPYLRRAVRSSMGAIFELPVIETASLVETLKQVRQRGVRCVAAHPHTNGHTLAQANLRASCCIVLGSEGNGLSPAVLEVCDEAAAIPMPPTVDSLNVGSAAAIFFYEAKRQRNQI